MSLTQFGTLQQDVILTGWVNMEWHNQVAGKVYRNVYGEYELEVPRSREKTPLREIENNRAQNHFNPRHHRTSAHQGGAWCGTCIGVLQGYWQATARHLAAKASCRTRSRTAKTPSHRPPQHPLPVLERRSPTVSHERCQDCHPV